MGVSHPQNTSGAYLASLTSDESAYQYDSTYNYKYINGGASESFAYLSDDDGSVGLEKDSSDGMVIIKRIPSHLLDTNAPVWKNYAYELFTVTNVGAVYDIGYQLYQGEITTGEATLYGGSGVKGFKTFSSFSEARKLYSQWGKGSFDTVKDSIMHHANKHGGGDVVTYMRRASNFNKRGAHSSGPRDDGSTLWERRTGEFIEERDGKIITYGWNRR